MLLSFYECDPSLATPTVCSTIEPGHNIFARIPSEDLHIVATLLYTNGDFFQTLMHRVVKQLD